MSIGRESSPASCAGSAPSPTEPEVVTLPKERIIGYVLVDPNTHAMDWDGDIHYPLENAVRELVEECHRPQLEEPFEYGAIEDPADLAYMICAVVRVPDADRRALRRLQAAREKAAIEWMGQQ